jgi:hypothetical protein
MFKVEVNEFTTPTIRLLKNIEGLLIAQNELLKQSLNVSDKLVAEEIKTENKANIDTMDRAELVALIKTMPKGTVKGKYMAMNITELRNAVKEVL